MSSFYDFTGELPQTIRDAQFALMTNRSAFFANGLFALDDSPSGGGDYARRRYSAEDSAHDVTITGDAKTPGYVGSHVDMAPIMRRMRYRRILAQTGAAEGSLGSANDPENRVLAQSAQFWAGEWDLAAVSVITACFGTGGCLASTHTLDRATAEGAKVTLSYSALVDAMALLGDRGSEAIAVVTHSKAAADLMKESGGKSTFIPISGTRMFDSGLFVGSLRLLVSDALPVVGSDAWAAYTSVVLCPGSLWFSPQTALTEVRAPVPSVPALDVTEHWAAAVGVSGVKYTGLSVPPSNANLATAGDWSLTISPATPASIRSVGMAALVTNVSSA
jgi:hypothetical protein